MTEDVDDWGVYLHAYGPASDIPDLLQQAERAPLGSALGAEPWHSLWSALCHQDTVYPASYRALTELVRIAQARSDVTRSEALLLAAAILVSSREPEAPPVPASLQDAISRAQRDALELLRELPVPRDPVFERIHSIATAAFSGDISAARALLDSDIDAQPMGPA